VYDILNSQIVVALGAKAKLEILYKKVTVSVFRVRMPNVTDLNDALQHLINRLVEPVKVYVCERVELQ